MIKILFRYLPEGTEEFTKIRSQDSQCSGWDSKGAPPEYKSRAISLYRLARWMAAAVVEVNSLDILLSTLSSWRIIVKWTNTCAVCSQFQLTVFGLNLAVSLLLGEFPSPTPPNQGHTHKFHGTSILSNAVKKAAGRYLDRGRLETWRMAIWSGSYAPSHKTHSCVDPILTYLHQQRLGASRTKYSECHLTSRGSVLLSAINRFQTT
jgi:hypothetical protein